MMVIAAALRAAARGSKSFGETRRTMMRHTTPMTMALLLAASLTAGCSAKDGTAVDQERDEAKEKAKAQTKEAAQAVSDYAYAQKAEFVAGMKDELAKTRKELDELSAKVETSTGEAKAKAQEKLDAARERWTKVEARLDTAESAAESEWEGVQRDLEQANEDMKASLDEARQWMSDKIEP